MPIREATWTDLLPASNLAAAAFFDDPFSGVFLRPYRHKYPHDSYLTTLRKLRQAYFTPTSKILISYTDESALGSNHGPSLVTGVALWTQAGESSKALLASQSWLGWLAMRCMSLVNILHSRIYQDRSIEKSKFALFEISEGFTRHYFENPPARKERLYLDLCATSPEFQGKGYGREMVLWGVRKAKAEGLVAGLIASHSSPGFYEKCGFKTVGYATEGVGNPLADIPGGAIMFV